MNNMNSSELLPEHPIDILSRLSVEISLDLALGIQEAHKHQALEVMRQAKRIDSQDCEILHLRQDLTKARRRPTWEQIDKALPVAVGEAWDLLMEVGETTAAYKQRLTHCVMERIRKEVADDEIPS